MERIRIFLAALPRMLREIIESAVAGQPDMSIVGAVDTRERVTTALSHTPAEVVIVGLRDAETTAMLRPMLFEQPRLKLLAIGGDERSAFLYELRPHTVPLGDVSAQGIVDAIRSAVVSEVL